MGSQAQAVVGASRRTSRQRQLDRFYEEDEPAWRDEMSRLLRGGRVDELDCKNLAELLDSDARASERDINRRCWQVIGRLLFLDARPHGKLAARMLPREQRELRALLTSSLREHAVNNLERNYQIAVKLAGIGLRVPPHNFSAKCPYSLSRILGTKATSGPRRTDEGLVDRTAWLHRMSQLAEQKRVSDLDRDNLAEYLDAMSISNRREIGSRLVILITHLLKWQYQPEKRGSSWENTIAHQRFELEQASTKSLRNYAEEALPRLFQSAVEEAARQTKLGVETFPNACPYTLDQILTEETA